MAPNLRVFGGTLSRMGPVNGARTLVTAGVSSSKASSGVMAKPPPDGHADPNVTSICRFCSCAASVHVFTWAK